MKTLPQQEEVVQRHAPIFATTVHAEHRHISPMFYGEANAFLGSPPVPWLQIARRLNVPEPKGTEVKGVLESGAFVPEWGAAMCAVHSDDQH